MDSDMCDIVFLFSSLRLTTHVAYYFNANANDLYHLLNFSISLPVFLFFFLKVTTARFRGKSASV